MKRTATAHWAGTLKDGKGSLSTPSGILNNANYSFKTRFEEGVTGTNPEELLAAAHAGCFTMWVSSLITEKGLQATSLDTVAAITLVDGTITGSHLTITGNVTGMTSEEFTALTKEAETNCIISKSFSFPVSSEAHFVN